MLHKLVLCLCLASFVLQAQSKTPPPPADWGKWESLGFTRPELSHDGAWLAYRVQRTDGNHELRITGLRAAGVNRAVKFGEQPAFSADSLWVAYLIGIHEDEEEKLKKDKKPVRKKLGLIRLDSGETATFDNIESFRFAPVGAYLAMRHYAAEAAPPPPAGPGAPPPTPDPKGAPLTVRDLAAGTSTNFGNVASFAWEPKGRLLAMTTSTEGRAGNALQVFDPAAGSLRALDSANAHYHGLAWRRDSKDLAVLRTRSDEQFEEETCDVLVFFDASSKAMLDSKSVPEGQRIVKQRAPAWSEDGSMLFVGLAAWEKKPAPMTKKAGDPEPAAVEVWHSSDVRVISEQKLTANRDRERSSMAVVHWKPSPRLVRLSTNPDERIATQRDVTLAIDAKPYERSAMFGRPYHDVSRIDLQSGARTRVIERVEWASFLARPSNTGRYFLYPRDQHLWLCDISTGQQTNLTKGMPASAFLDVNYDHPVTLKPPYGIAGWTANDRSVLVYDEFDVWEFFPDGSKPRRLTNGAADQVEYRYVQLDAEEKFIDPGKPVYLAMAGKWTKRSGFGRLMNGKVETLVWEDKMVGRPLKARDADRFVWVSQSYDDSPDYFTAEAADFRAARQVSATNPFHGDYAWGRSELIEYRSPAGVRLQAALRYPASYEPGKQYPMIVHFYEQVSREHHRYYHLSPREMYSDSVFTSLGYFVLRPDIVFRPRDPGRSIVECLTAAVKKALENKAIDPKRVGLTGHSWGGYGTVFTSTQSDLFAAAVAGAPLTNLSSSYGEIYGNNGIPETNHVETGQERMDVPVYEDTEAYVRNSAPFAANRLRAPLLIAHGDKDGACDLHQSMEMYNAVRRAGKPMVLLVYAGENHGLNSKPVRLDYQRRSIEWFGHYLKGEPAPDWMVKGVTHLEREKDLKRWKEAKVN